MMEKNEVKITNEVCGYGSDLGIEGCKECRLEERAYNVCGAYGDFSCGNGDECRHPGEIMKKIPEWTKMDCKDTFNQIRNMKERMEWMMKRHEIISSIKDEEESGIIETYNEFMDHLIKAIFEMKKLNEKVGKHYGSDK